MLDIESQGVCGESGFKSMFFMVNLEKNEKNSVIS